MLLELEDSQLVLIDYQNKLMPQMLGADLALANAQVLGQMAQWLQVPCWGTEQAPQNLGPMREDLRALCQQVLGKTHFNACEEGLLERLRPPAKVVTGGNARSMPRHLQKNQASAPAVTERNSIVLAGCEAHICLLQTALTLIENEFEVWVVTDACASRQAASKDAALDRLAAAGAELVSTEMVAFEWLRSCEHPRFKDVLALIK